MTNKGRRYRLLWGLAIILAAGPLLAAEPTTKPAPGRIRLTVSRKTTHILGPVNKDGTVNYVAYLNAKHSKGVTKTNNAVIPLIKILGPRLLPRDTARDICKILKIQPPVKGANTFIPLFSYIEKILSTKDAKAWNERENGPTISNPKPWSDNQYPVLAEWLKANTGALNATLAAMKRTRYYLPAISQDPDGYVADMSRAGVQSYVTLNEALVARAMLKLDSNDPRGAWADLMAARHLARRIGSGHTLIDSLTAIAIERRACSACNEVASSGKLTGAQARAFLADMQRLGPLPDMVDRISTCERFVMLDTVMMLARAKNRRGLKGLNDILGEMAGMVKLTSPVTLLNAGALKWDKTLLVVNPWYERLVAAYHQKTFKARTKALAEYHRRFQEFMKKVKRTQSFPRSVLTSFNDPSTKIGNILVLLLMPPLDKAVVLRDRTTVRGRLSIIAMALAAYKAEKKAYPDKLSKLSPGYLKKVPDDLFIDKPFGYKRTDKGYLLYSVGENMKFDGEKKEDDDDEEKDDIVVRVE